MPDSAAAVSLVLDARRQGAYGEAARRLESLAPSAERYLLAAQIADEQGDARGVIAALAEAEEEGYLVAEETAGVAEALRGCAYLALDQPLEADRAISRVDVDRMRHHTAAQATYYLARAANLRHDPKAARKLLSERSPRDTTVRVQYDLLRADSHMQQEGFDEAAIAVRDGLATALKGAPQETALIAKAARHLASIVREVPLSGAADLLMQVDRKIEWSESIAGDRSAILRGIGIGLALNGDYLRGLQYLARALHLARNSEEQLAAHVDYVCAARWAHELNGALAHLSVVDDLVPLVSWADAGEDARVALVTAAFLNAEVDVERAQTYLARVAMRTHEPGWMFGGDRFRALVNAATCRIGESGSADAARAGKDAYRIFNAAGFKWRSAQTALDIHRVIGELKWLDRAKSALKSYRQGHLYAEVERRETVPELSERLRELLLHMREGKDTDEIAASMNVSRNTVRNHIQRLYKMFDVTHRVELLAKTRDAISA